MEVIIRIETDNEAFHGSDAWVNLRPELARILRKYADDVEEGKSLELTLRDINGNTVGEVTVR